MSNSATAAPSPSELTCCRPMRCCLTRITTPFVSLEVCRGGGSMTGATIWWCSSVSRGPCAGAPFLELPEAFRRLQQRLLRVPGGDREMVEVLALVLHHDEQAVLVAVELALEDGVPTKTPIFSTSFIGCSTANR